MAIPIKTPPMPFEGQAIPPYLDLHCTNCGYLLTGLKNRVCPECGQPFDPLETWQQNRKSTWEFHFSYYRPLWQYVLGGLFLLPALAIFVFVGIAFGPRVYLSPVWHGSGLLATGVLFVLSHYYDWHGLTFWMTLLYVWAALGFVGAF